MGGLKCTNKIHIFESCDCISIFFGDRMNKIEMHQWNLELHLSCDFYPS